MKCHKSHIPSLLRILSHMMGVFYPPPISYIVNTQAISLLIAGSVALTESALSYICSYETEIEPYKVISNHYNN